LVASIRRCALNKVAGRKPGTTLTRAVLQTFLLVIAVQNHGIGYARG
jgi:hypothetical protein